MACEVRLLTGASAAGTVGRERGGESAGGAKRALRTSVPDGRRAAPRLPLPVPAKGSAPAWARPRPRGAGARCAQAAGGGGLVAEPLRGAVW